MKHFVLDCSIAMAWCFSDEANELSDQTLMLFRTYKAIVPSIWPLEIINVLRVGECKKRIIASQANSFLSLLSALPIEVDGGLCDLPNRKLLDISREYALSAYDAAYLELSLRKNIPFFSFDKPLCEAAQKAGIQVNFE